MSRFELRTSSIRSDRSANCATPRPSIDDCCLSITSVEHLSINYFACHRQLNTCPSFFSIVLKDVDAASPKSVHNER